MNVNYKWVYILNEYKLQVMNDCIFFNELNFSKIINFIYIIWSLSTKCSHFRSSIFGEVLQFFILI